MTRAAQVVLAAAGLEHSLAVIVADQSSEAYVFAFGDNSFGQLGVEVSAAARCLRVNRLTPLPLLQSQLPSDFAAVTLPNKDSAVVHIAAGGNLSCCVGSDGLLVYWGCLSDAAESAVCKPSVMQVCGG